jgi:hypothetical protein
MTALRHRTTCPMPTAVLMDHRPHRNHRHTGRPSKAAARHRLGLSRRLPKAAS